MFALIIAALVSLVLCPTARSQCSADGSTDCSADPSYDVADPSDYYTNTVAWSMPLPNSAVRDPTGGSSYGGSVIANLINGDYSNNNLGWNPQGSYPSDGQGHYYYPAQFNWSSSLLVSGWPTSRVAVSSFAVQVVNDGAHLPTMIGLIPDGGTDLSRSVLNYTVPPLSSNARYVLTISLPQPVGCLSPTVFFFNGAHPYQVYIYQVQFFGFPSIVPSSVSDPYHTTPNGNQVVGNILVPGSSGWNPTVSSNPNYPVYCTILSFASTYTVVGFQLYETLDGAHEITTVGYYNGANSVYGNRVQTWSLPALYSTANNYLSWKSFAINSTFWSPALSQISLFYIDQTSGFQVYLSGVQVYVGATCPAGYGNSGPASIGSNVLSCSVCPLGYYAPSDGVSPCTPCPAGSYNNVTGVSSCTLCPAGTASSVTGAMNISSCSLCAAGQSSSAGSTACSTCSAGTYSPAPGSASCIVCPAGQYQSAQGSSSCSVCPSNTLSPANSVSISACAACPSGTTGGGRVPVCCPGAPSASGLQLAQIIYDATRIGSSVYCLLQLETLTACGAGSAVNFASSIYGLAKEVAALAPSTALYCNS